MAEVFIRVGLRAGRRDRWIDGWRLSRDGRRRGDEGGMSLVPASYRNSLGVCVPIGFADGISGTIILIGKVLRLICRVWRPALSSSGDVMALESTQRRKKPRVPIGVPTKMLYLEGSLGMIANKAPLNVVLPWSALYPIIPEFKGWAL